MREPTPSTKSWDTEFGKLIASEAAVRAESIYRRKFVRLDQQQQEGKQGRKTVDFPVIDPDRGKDRQEVVDNLYETFLHIYNFVYQDSTQHHRSVGRKDVCTTADLLPEDLVALKGLFTKFADSAYDIHGNLTLTPETAPKALEDLYVQLRDVELKGVQSKDTKWRGVQSRNSEWKGAELKEAKLHSTGIAVGALFVEMGRGKKWKTAFKRESGDCIDFTRGDPADNLDARFRNAISGPEQTPTTDPYIQHSENIITIEGVRFLGANAKVSEQGDETKRCLVTQTGHIVQLTPEVEEKITRDIRNKTPINDLRVEIEPDQYLLNKLDVKSDHFTDLPKNARRIIEKELKPRMETMAHTGMVDGEKLIPDNGKITAPLMSMDVDVMTGLTFQTPSGSSELERLADFMKEQGIKKFTDLIPEEFNVNILALKKTKPQAAEAEQQKLRDNIKHKMAELEKAANDESLKDIIRRASAQLQIMLPRACEVADDAFINHDDMSEKSKATRTPRLYMTMGGSGSGKTSLRKMAEDECGNHALITASLDDVRGQFDHYRLYTATNNQNDDYLSVEIFGNTVRDLVTERARKGGYNLIIDGSGIPYEDRNDKTTREFKRQGYHVSVLGAQVPLYVGDPEGRKELSEGIPEKRIPPHTTYSDAFWRNGERLAQNLLTLPLDRSVDKHIGHALATRNAARDPNVDRYICYDVSPEKENAYVLSYVLPKVEQETLDLIAPPGKIALIGGILRSKLESLGLSPDKLPLPKNSKYYNFKVIRDNSVDNPDDHTYRVEVITNIPQYTNMVQKGLYCRKTKGPDELYKNTVHADIEEIFKGPKGRLNFTHKEGVGRASWPINHTQRALDEASQLTSAVGR